MTRSKHARCLETAIALSLGLTATGCALSDAFDDVDQQTSPVNASSSQSLRTILTDQELLEGLTLLIDAGDADSYDGQSQMVIDLSGQDHHFYLGMDGDTAGDDPTFMGAPGGRSAAEHFAFGEGQLLRAVGERPEWSRVFHKNHVAYTILTVASFERSGAGGNQGILFSTGPAGACACGYEFRIQSDPKYIYNFMDVNVAGGRCGGHSVLHVAGELAPSFKDMNFLAVSNDEDEYSGFLMRNSDFVKIATVVNGEDEHRFDPPLDNFNTYGWYDHPAGTSESWCENRGQYLSGETIIGGQQNYEIWQGEENLSANGGLKVWAVAIWVGVTLTKEQLDKVRTALLPRFVP